MNFSRRSTLGRAGGRLRIPEDHWFVSDDLLAELI